MENRTATITGKTWKIGKKTLVLTITKTITQILGIQNGDTIEAQIKKIQTEETEQKQTTKKEKTPSKKEIDDTVKYAITTSKQEYEDAKIGKPKITIKQ